MGRIKSSKVAASSLLEVVVAMVLAATVFGLGTVIYVNVSQSGFSQRHFRAMLLAEQVAAETQANLSFYDQTLSFAGWTVHKKVYPYPNAADLVHLHLEVTAGSSQPLVSSHRLIRAKSYGHE